MANRNKDPVKKLLRSMRRKPNRFRQVQRALRRDSKYKFPVSMYGRSDILTKEQWKKVINANNPKELLDSMNKMDEKARLRKAGVMVPETYMYIESLDDIPRLDNWLEGWDRGFAIKPISGHGGSGIKVIDRRVAGRFITISGKGIGKDDIIKHAERILRGTYTRSEPDIAMVERRLVLDRSLRELLTPGLLDIRIVAFKGFPLMAMTRLPTRRSKGKANIHQGAIGAGISIAEGRITSATLFRGDVKRHPNSGRQIVGFKFNMWEKILETASLAADASGLGFVGVDLTVDSESGVVVLEVNKRPGLEIQNANRAGMMRRIKWVERYLKGIQADPSSIGPGIKAELSRKWDSTGWQKVKEGMTEE